MSAFDDVRRLMTDIERLLEELSAKAIDGDPEMHDVLREAKKGEPPCR